MRIVVTQFGSRRGRGVADFKAARRLLAARQSRLQAGDLVLLPELIGNELDHDNYLSEVLSLARDLKIWVVGGSYFNADGERLVNTGLVADPQGMVVARYGKSNPYGSEHRHQVVPGSGPAAFTLNGARCLVMICADFWHASAFPADQFDLILVPAFSASQRPDPAMARARWRHAMIARAYEHAAYVAVSDWEYPTPFHNLKSSGVAAWARPNPDDPRALFTKLGRRRIQEFELDMGALRDLRENRESRGFNPTKR
jgi:predicted amidohydrolase